MRGITPKPDRIVNPILGPLFIAVAVLLEVAKQPKIALGWAMAFTVNYGVRVIRDFLTEE